MSYFNMVCDVCGREVYSCNIVNGMKFCAKCYQETFGNQQNKETSELLVNSLAEKDKQIAELQKQLKEKEEEIEELQKDYEFKDKDCAINLKRFCDVLTKNVQLEFLIKDLQSELKSQPAEIMEKIKEQIFNHFNVKNIEEYERLSLQNALFTADAVAEILDTILKEYQK